MRGFVTGLAALSLFFAAACTTVYDPYEKRRISIRHPRVIKPVVAIADFENRANFSGRWSLGEGMADILTTELLDTERVVVLERAQLGHVIDEIARQGREMFRVEGRVQRGRLKNARYLVTGAITDFTVTKDASGWFGVKNAQARGRGSKARVSLHLRVSEVETGEVLASIKTDASASSGMFGASVNYKDFNFGGDAFFRTPLGRATEKAIRRAVGHIVESIPVTIWRPVVAEAGPEAVIINGGNNVGVKAGMQYAVRSTGRVITDPVTGDPLEKIPGPIVGRVEVMRVNEVSAYARLLEGKAERGHALEPLAGAE